MLLGVVAEIVLWERLEVFAGERTLLAVSGFHAPLFVLFKKDASTNAVSQKIHASL